MLIVGSKLRGWMMKSRSGSSGPVGTENVELVNVNRAVLYRTAVDAVKLINVNRAILYRAP